MAAGLGGGTRETGSRGTTAGSETAPPTFTRVNLAGGDDRDGRSRLTPVMGCVECRITVRGTVSDRFAHAFRGMELMRSDGETVLVGAIEDQSHLFGILDRIRDFGLELMRVEQS